MGYILCVMLPALLFTGAAQFYLSNTYKKWKEERNSAGVTGRQTADKLMRQFNLPVNEIHVVEQELGDHYDPRNHTVGMSRHIATAPSIASMAVAAHEFGHVQQYAEKSPLIAARTFILPAAQIGSNLGYFLIFGGLMLSYFAGSSGLGFMLAFAGLLLFGAAVLFSILTLPVEFDASRRAMKMLNEAGLIRTQEDRSGTQAVLRAAALTYVAGTAAAILNFVYYAMLVMGMNRD